MIVAGLGGQMPVVQVLCLHQVLGCLPAYGVTPTLVTVTWWSDREGKYRYTVYSNNVSLGIFISRRIKILQFHVDIDLFKQMLL